MCVSLVYHLSRSQASAWERADEIKVEGTCLGTGRRRMNAWAG